MFNWLTYYQTLSEILDAWYVEGKHKNLFIQSYLLECIAARGDLRRNISKQATNDKIGVLFALKTKLYVK